MIGDYEVDLTIEHKFGGIDRVPSDFGNNLREEIRMQKSIPWFRRRSDFDLSPAKQRRKYGDYISDDFGLTIRRCSDGKWFIAGGDKEELSQAERNLPYYIDEEMGTERGSALVSCVCCGRIFFSRGCLECNECKTGMRSEVYYKILNKQMRNYKLTERIRMSGSL